MPLMTKGIVDATGTIHALIDGQVIPVPNDHPAYAKIREGLDRGDTEIVLSYADVPTALKRFTCGRILVDGEKVFCNFAREGEPARYDEVGSEVGRRALELLRNGLPFEPLLKFLDRLLKNPSRRAVQELYTWLKFQAIPITDDGCFLGYKRVNSAGRSFSSGPNKTIVVHPDGRVEVIPPNTPVPYPIGGRVYVERNEVDENYGVACSEGIHVGDISYVNSFYAGQGKILIVKVDPADVVTVPPRETNKLRTASVDVLAYSEGVMTTPLYTADAQPYQVGPPPSSNGHGHGIASAASEISDAEYEEVATYDEIDEEAEEDELDEDEGHEYKLQAERCPHCRRDLRTAFSLLLTMGAEDDADDRVNESGTLDKTGDEICADEGDDAYDLVKDDLDSGNLLTVHCAACKGPLSAVTIHYHGKERIGALETVAAEEAASIADAPPALSTPTAGFFAALGSLFKRR